MQAGVQCLFRITAERGDRNSDVGRDFGQNSRSGNLRLTPDRAIIIGTMNALVEVLPHLLNSLVVIGGFGAWFLAAFAYFKVIANRKPGVSWLRAYQWLRVITWERHVYLEDLFTEQGCKWAKRSILAVLASMLMIFLGLVTFVWFER